MIHHPLINITILRLLTTVIRVPPPAVADQAILHRKKPVHHATAAEHASLAEAPENSTMSRELPAVGAEAAQEPEIVLLAKAKDIICPDAHHKTLYVKNQTRTSAVLLRD